MSPIASAFTGSLSWGSDYTLEMRARDTANLWSDWESISFNTNAAPTVPSQLSPANAVASSSRPTLRCVSSDADDNVASGQIVKARIYDDTDTLLGTYSMTKGASNTWSLVTTSTHLPSFGTYSWDAYAGDGTLWSGATTVEASATASARATFIYADGPQVTIDSPTDAEVLTTSTPTFDWSVTLSGGATQVSYTVSVVRASDSEEVHTETVVDAAASSYVMPAAVLRDGETYELTVLERDALGRRHPSELHRECGTGQR